MTITITLVCKDDNGGEYKETWQAWAIGNEWDEAGESLAAFANAFVGRAREKAEAAGD